MKIVVIGAGMAGASIAAELAHGASVLIMEAEGQPGYHSTGRSAAFWSESYGGPLVQPLTTASGPFLQNPPRDFSDRPFLGPRGAVHIAGDEGRQALRAFEQDYRGVVRLESLDIAALEAIVPGLRPGWDEGVLEPTCADIDVAGLHAAYLRAARRAGAELRTYVQVRRIERRHGRWLIGTDGGEVKADVVVNAAGAWADDIAALAEVQPLGIRPFRRTMVQLRVSPPVQASLPLVIDALGRFYFKPESGRLWLSPHDETPCAAADCAAEEIDVALAIERLRQVVEWDVERVERSWAGLRSFAPDRLPIYGFAADAPSFFWCAGQGGFGIQTAPAAAKMAAALLLGKEPDPVVAHIDPAPFRPERFAST